MVDLSNLKLEVINLLNDSSTFF